MNTDTFLSGCCEIYWRRESGDIDLAEDPEMHLDAATWIRRHGSCRESMRYDAEPKDVNLVEDPFWWALRHESDTWIWRHGSCRGS